MLPADHPFWATHSPPNGWGGKCRVFGARDEAGARRLRGDPGKTLPPGWDRPDPRTGASTGIDKGWAYAPGAGAAEAIRALTPKRDHLPARPSIDLIQDWLRLPSFAAWMRAPVGVWPLARLSDADAGAIGARGRIALRSEATMRKQAREHPELEPGDYAEVQRTISEATFRVQDGPRSLVFIRVASDGERGGLVTVVKATRTGKGLFVVSVRRLSRDVARRDATIAALLGKEAGWDRT